jgi:hypothetical protein
MLGTNLRASFLVGFAAVALAACVRAATACSLAGSRRDAAARRGAAGRAAVRVPPGHQLAGLEVDLRASSRRRSDGR